MDLGDGNGAVAGALSSRRHVKLDSEIIQARTYLKNFNLWRSDDTDSLHSREDFEQPFVCKISAIEWLDLCSEFNEFEDGRDRPWARFSYDSATSTLKIYAMPSLVHEGILGFVRDHLIRVTDTIHEPLRSEIDFFTNLKISDFIEEYQESSKVPDLAIGVMNNNGVTEIKWILEVGFSETYQEIQQDMRLWLNGLPTCRLAVLINITESPKYRCPLDFDLGNHDIAIPKNPEEIRAEPFSLKGKYGPVEYKGYQWAGLISEVTMETWARNSATTKELERKGGLVQIIPSTDSSPQFRLGDILDVSPTDPQTTSFDWDRLRDRLKYQIRSLAAARCRSWLVESLKREGLLGDKAYEPS